MTTPQKLQISSLAWIDAFLLGYEPMDAVHREFVAVVDALLRCPDDDLLARIDAFIVHARLHFGDEEAWMADSAFPVGDCHAGDHAAVLKSAHEVRALVATGRFDVGRSFAAALARWFPAHADYLDAALSHWLFKHRHGGKPVILRRTLAQPSLALKIPASVDATSADGRVTYQPDV